MCYRRDTYDDLQTFTVHMDECLARQCVDDAKCSKSDSSSSKSTKSSKGITNSVKSASKNLPGLPTCNSSELISHSSNPPIPESPASNHGNEEPALILTCPICNAPQRRSSLLLFNQHVDMCLNRQAIRDVIQDPNTSSKRSEHYDAFQICFILNILVFSTIMTMSTALV